MYISGGVIMPRQKFTTTIDSELLERIKIQAIKEKCSVAALLERLINDYLSSNPESKAHSD